jgi:hypothetical protein
VVVSKPLAPRPNIANLLDSQQPWSTYALHIATFTSLSITFDPWILFLAYKVAESYKPGYGWHGFFVQLAWIFVTKVIKRVHLFIKRPSDLKYLPVSILFGYFHGFIKIYALTTLNMVSRTHSILMKYLVLTASRPPGEAVQMEMQMITTA